MVYLRISIQTNSILVLFLFSLPLFIQLQFFFYRNFICENFLNIHSSTLKKNDYCEFAVAFDRKFWFVLGCCGSSRLCWNCLNLVHFIIMFINVGQMCHSMFFMCIQPRQPNNILLEMCVGSRESYSIDLRNDLHTILAQEFFFCYALMVLWNIRIK